MTDISGPLRDADPLQDAPELPDAEASAMRQTVLAAVRVETMRRPIWSDAIALAALLTLMIGLGVQMGRRLPSAPAAPVASGDSQPKLLQPRQLQFSTPGGTRIIWTFDPEFGLKEPLP